MNAETPNLVRIVGGLGNQLFQYAFGLYLEDLTGRETSFDLRALQGYTLHGGGLAVERVFDLSIPVASEHDIRRHPGWLGSSLTSRALYRLSPHMGGIIPLITDYNFKPERARQSAAATYHGYWQKPAYASKAISKLQFRPEVEAEASKIIRDNHLDPLNDVAVHIRRGDYLRLPRSCHLPLPEAGYYLPLMRFLSSRGSGRFVVFSDDIAALRAGPLAPLRPLFIDSSLSSGPATDLCLISQFRTQILSASSFSWWGAALNRNRQAIVLAPDPWVKLAFRSDPHAAAEAMSTWTLIDTSHIQSAESSEVHPPAPFEWKAV